MSQFIETIRFQYGKMIAPGYHHKRMDDTLIHFGAKRKVDLQEVVCPPELSHIAVLKCRILYDLLESVHIEFTPYAFRSISSVSLASVSGKDYSFKYADRQWINELLHSSGTDEIIMYDEMMIKDASYANLTFFDGHRWVTPAQPLLRGTRREQLLNEKIIFEEEVYVNQLDRYTQLKFINAMMTWDESPMMDIKGLSL